MDNSGEHTTGLWLFGLLALMAPLGLRLHVAEQTLYAQDATRATRRIEDQALSRLLTRVVPSGEITAHVLLPRADVVVATLPDPDAGALGMLADQAIDAISSSAVRAGYVADVHALPWKGRLRASQQHAAAARSGKSTDAAEDAAGGGGDDDASEPADPVADDQKLGALLFRRERGAEPQWLIVFLVAESPLGGISVPALRRALGLAGCRDPATALRVLAPAFSGSARTLWRVLNECSAHARVLSGSATGDLGEEALAPRHAFGRAVVPDSQMLAFLLKELADQNDLARASRPRTPQSRSSPARVRVAILSEPGTAYAADLSKFATDSYPALRLLRYQLPFHLAELRSKYAAQHVPAAVSQLRRGLHFDLAAYDDTRTRTDYVPAFSSLTAPSVEMALRSLLQDIARRPVDYLVIVATDPADGYFLASEARVYAPMTQSIILGGNLLYAHPEVSSAMSGVLMLSSYPLHLELQRGQFEHERKLFDSDTSEGVFNAMQWLIADLDHRHPERCESFAPVDYSVYGDAKHGPRSWLTLISNNRLWPLRHGDAASAPEGCARCIHAAKAPSLQPPAPRDLDHASDSVTELSAATTQRSACQPTRERAPSDFVRASPLGAGAGLLALFVGVCHLLVFGIARWGTQSHDMPYIRAFAAPRRNRLATTQYQMATYLALGLFGALASILAQRIYHWDWLHRNWLSGNWGRAVCGVLLAGVLPLISLALLTCALWVLIGWLRRPNKLGRAGWQGYLIFLPMFVLVVAAVRCGFELHASIYLDSGPLLLIRLSDPVGPCPLVMLFCLGFGLYLWAVTGLSRASACARFPRRAPIGIGIELGPRLSDLTDESPRARVRERTRNAALAMLACLAALMLWIASSLRPSFEWRGYDDLVKLLIMTLSGAVAFASLHAYLLWGVMRDMLVEHAALPMVDAYARIASKVTHSFGLQLRSHVPPPRELTISLRSLTLLIGLAQKIHDEHWSVPERLAAGSSETEPHPIALAIVQARAAIAACLADLHRAYCAPVKAPTEHSGVRFSPAETEAIHRAFFAASDKLYEVLSAAWLERVRSPTLPTRADGAEAWLPGGTFGTVPTALVIANAVPYSCRLWIRAAEDFVAMRVTTYVYFIINQIRLCLGFAVLGALVLVSGVFAYPLQPQHFATVFSGFMLIVAVYTALRIIIGMQYNELLRRLTPLSSSALNITLVKQIVTYVAVPSVVLMSRVFPALADVFSRAVEPVMTFLR